VGGGGACFVRGEKGVSRCLFASTVESIRQSTDWPFDVLWILVLVRSNGRITDPLIGIKRASYAIEKGYQNRSAWQIQHPFGWK